METLIETHYQQIESLEIRFRRDLAIDWKDRLIGLTGARGVGKSTFLLTYLKNN